MPKRPRTYKKARRRTRRRTRRYSRISKPVVRQMIRKAVKPLTRVTRLHLYGDALALQANYNIYNLTLIANADRVFNTVAQDHESRRCKHTSLRLDCLIQCNTENDGTTLTAYIVSPKANAEDAFFDSASGGLTLGASGTSFQTMSGQAYLNPDYFKIYMRKKLFFAPTGAADVRNTNVMFKRFTFNMKPQWNLRNNGAAEWGDLVCPQLPHQNLYLLIFNDNQIIDAEWPTVSYTVLNTYVS